MLVGIRFDGGALQVFGAGDRFGEDAGKVFDVEEKQRVVEGGEDDD